MSLSNLQKPNNLKIYASIIDVKDTFVNYPIVFTPSLLASLVANNNKRIGNIIQIDLRILIVVPTTKGVNYILGNVDMNYVPSSQILTLASDITTPDAGICVIDTNGQLSYNPLNTTTLSPILVECHIMYIQN